MMRKIEDREAQELVFPVTLGRDFSGVIIQTGKGVTKLKMGDEVSESDSAVFCFGLLR